MRRGVLVAWGKFGEGEGRREWSAFSGCGKRVSGGCEEGEEAEEGKEGGEGGEGVGRARRVGRVGRAILFTSQRTAPKSSGARTSMLPTSSPPLDPPCTPSRAAHVTPRPMRSRATASKSSYALCRFSLSAAWARRIVY